MTPEERFDALVDQLVGTAGVTPPSPGRGFGSSALRFQNKIFAMFVRGQLVVKLSKAQVDALVKSGDGVRFDANKGTPMKEWFALDPASELAWLPLAREALEFAGHRSGAG
jgi:TfoX/Sxy family transcriptional regulator of competence genes